MIKMTFLNISVLKVFLNIRHFVQKANLILKNGHLVLQTTYTKRIVLMVIYKTNALLMLLINMDIVWTLLYSNTIKTMKILVLILDVQKPTQINHYV